MSKPLPSRTTREQVSPAPSAAGAIARRSPRRANNRNTPAQVAPRKSQGERQRPVAPGTVRGRAAASPPSEYKRLSATDISALASMKNVAKCDTWCELQNPANHRVFERKLRPKPSGRGHACLGVTRHRPPHPRVPRGHGRWRKMASREHGLAVGPKARSPATFASATVVERPSHGAARRVVAPDPEEPDPFSQRDPRSGETTR